jgi:predicted MFS family arabinose efflux permease
MVGASAIDRADRRRLLLAMDLGRLVVVLIAGVLLLFGVGGVLLAYVVSVCVGVGSLLFDVTAGAVVGDECPPELLGRANSVLFAAEDSMRDLVGLAVGAVLFAVAVWLPFFVDAGTFAFSALMVASLRLTRTRAQLARDTEPESVRLREGVDYLRNHRVLRRIVGLWSAEAFLFGATFALLVYYALYALHLEAAGYGLLGAATGAGMLAGNLSAARIVGSRERGYARVLILIGVFAALAYVVVAAADTAIVAGVGLFVWGGAIGIGNVATSTLRQRLVPSGLFGRVVTVATVFNRSAIVVGAFAGGIAAAIGGARLPWILAACTQVVVVIGIAVLLRDEPLTAAIVAARRDPGDTPAA